MGKNLNGKELGKNLHQRKDGRYEGRYTDSHGKRQSVYGISLNEVRMKLNKALYEKETYCSGNITVDMWFDMWLENYKKGHIKDTTLNSIIGCYNRHIGKYIGDLHISSVKFTHIRKIYDKCAETGISKGQIRHIASILNNLFEKAHICGYINIDPCSGMKPVYGKEENHLTALTIEEQNLFFKYCKGSVYEDLFYILLFTGMRIGEATALLWSDIDFENNLIHINKTSGIYYDNLKRKSVAFIHNEPKTKSSVRNIPMCRKCREILLKLHQNKNCGIVFANKNGNVFVRTNINNAINKIVEKANKNEGQCLLPHFSVHCFRHTFATRCFECGIDVKTVQSFLGHSSIKMTMDIYTHISEKRKCEEIEKINNILW